MNKKGLALQAFYSQLMYFLKYSWARLSLRLASFGYTLAFRIY